MAAPLKLPIPVAAAALFALSVLELWLRPITDPVWEVIAVHVVLFGTLLTLPRAPVLVAWVLLAEVLVARGLILDRIGMTGGSMLFFVATFSAASLVPTRQAGWLVLHVVVQTAWRVKLGIAPFVAMYSDVLLMLAGIGVGVFLQRRHERLGAIRRERDRLVAALETGPGDAATAEQLRTWSLLEHRIEPAIDALPGMVETARAARDPADALHAVRARAADALAEMQATIHALGDSAPPTATRPAPPDVGRTRSISPLPVVCGLLVIEAVIEMFVGGQVSYFAPILALLPLLAPRALITTSVLVGVTAIVCSLAGEIPVAARAADYSAIITAVVAATTASLPRAVLSLVLVTTGLLVAQGLDPTFDWATLAFIGTAFVYVGHWFFGLRLREVATEQQQVESGLAEIADALAQLEARAARAERVRLARELHDLVGHALTAVAIQAGVAQARLRKGLAPEFEPLAAAARQGSAELRRLANVLGDDTDITAELARITDTARATGQRVQLELEEPPAELDPHVRHTLVAVASEALTNAAKHAAGATVRVRLDARPDRLELAVVDDGGDCQALPSGGRGTESMADRVRECGGTFVSGPRPEGGWTVQARLPLTA
ncbi:hypothetical protein DVA67_001425 [Solirubrobacter sp. CPCC 204708]|uniref:histidine kinase n=1 Tax=Solirubrobacter deserti TaxID=2282478 RepID=A0ABT4RDL3_9ACTN|nr:histidine kinase [Solirubrobacter deserti]MBE2314617.1 hypothetical protein [Solirubrobacter deserti]MDA0136624.1 histidine kinase [Solirubrobacter deserti]